MAQGRVPSPIYIFDFLSFYFIYSVIVNGGCGDSMEDFNEFERSLLGVCTTVG